jgi:hypothetical protein
LERSSVSSVRASIFGFQYAMIVGQSPANLTSRLLLVLVRVSSHGMVGAVKNYRRFLGTRDLNNRRSSR